MTDSLLLVEANLELVGSTTNPEYRLGQADLGAAEPDTTVIRGLLLDGDEVSGDRDHNRTISLSIPVHAIGASGTAAIRSALTASTDALLAAISKPTFTLQWTPDGGVPVLFDCFRGRGQRQRSIVRDNQGATPVSLAFQAKPFGRSPDVLSVTAAATVTQLDSFDTAPTGATLDTSVKYEGTGSARVTLNGILFWGGLRRYSTSSAVSRTYGTAKNLTGMNAVSMRMRWPAASAATITATLTLLSAAGNATIVVSKSFIAGDTKWRQVSFPLTGSLGTLDLTTVTGYTLTLVSGPVSGGTSTSSFWVDDQRMRPPSSALATTTHAANLLLTGVVGSARTPVNLALSNGGTFTAFLLHSPPTDQDVDAQILTSLSGSSADQTVTIAADAARFAGTYSIVLGVSTVGSGSTTTTVTVTQYANGTAVGSTTVLARTYTAGPHLVAVGEVTLPLYAVPDDNTTTTYTFEVAASGTERYTELMLLDTRGQTVYTDTDLTSARAFAYVDEPTSLQSGSLVYSTVTDRTAAFSAMGRVTTSGGPVLLEPGTNKILAWVSSSVPTVTASYFPRWLDERVI